MTKHRAPLSIEQALQRIAGQLADGVEEMARLTGHAAGYVRALGDPDRREKLSVEDAIAFDIAFQEAGGIGAPVWEAYTHKLELAQQNAFADRISLGLLTAEVIREGGQAHEALVRASQPGASPADRRSAEKEVSEAMNRLKESLAHLEAIDARPHPPP